jgi:RNA polymerase sporulation-specific sigma factor
MSVKDGISDVNTLILRVREGDQQAFSELLERYRPLIDSLIFRFGQSDLAKSFADDLRQEAIVVFYNAILTYSENQSDVEFGLYARICISNALVSQIRSINKRSVEQYVDSIPEELNNTNLSSSPMDDIVKQEDLRSLYRVIKNSLSDFEYVIWHNYISGKTAKEIALIMGKNEKSITNAIYRIRRKLRDLLK